MSRNRTNAPAGFEISFNHYDGSWTVVGHSDGTAADAYEAAFALVKANHDDTTARGLQAVRIVSVATTSVILECRAWFMLVNLGPDAARRVVLI